jgi:hypothetical protein
MTSNKTREPVMNCLQCHNPLPLTANFCGKCGTTIPGKNKKPQPKPDSDMEQADASAKEDGIDLLAYVKHQRASLPGQEPSEPTTPDHEQVVLEAPTPAPQGSMTAHASQEASVALMSDLKAQIDAIGVSAPVKTPILPTELMPSDKPSPAQPTAAAVGFSSEQWAQWQEMMDELRDRMDAWTQHMSAAASSDLNADPMQVWREVQETVSAQGQQLETMMSQMNSLAAQSELQALGEQLAQWRATSEKSLQLELQKAPQVEAKLVVHQNEQMQALGQLQQELRAFALAGAQSAGRLMAIEQAVTQLQARLGVEPGHAVPPAAPQRVLSAPPPPLEKVERVKPKTQPKWVNGLMIGVIAVVLCLTAVMAGMAVYNFMSYSSLPSQTPAKDKASRAEKTKDAHP